MVWGFDHRGAEGGHKETHHEPVLCPGRSGLGRRVAVGQETGVVLRIEEVKYRGLTGQGSRSED